MAATSEKLKRSNAPGEYVELDAGGDDGELPRPLPFIMTLVNEVPQQGAALVAIVTYLGVGTFFYSAFEQWSYGRSLYFSVVTMSTVGYGDLSPGSTFTQAFTLLYIFVGIIGIFPLVRCGVANW